MITVPVVHALDRVPDTVTAEPAGPAAGYWLKCTGSSIWRKTRGLIKKPTILSGTTFEYAEQP